MKRTSRETPDVTIDFAAGMKKYEAMLLTRREESRRTAAMHFESFARIEAQIRVDSYSNALEDLRQALWDSRVDARKHRSNEEERSR